MLSITDGGSFARALQMPLDVNLRDLLVRRGDQLGGDIVGRAHLVIVQPGDRSASAEEVLGFSPFRNPVDGSSFGEADFTPAWEWIEDHGFCFELAFTFDDSGFAHAIIVEKSPRAPRRLMKLCEAHASERV